MLWHGEKPIGICLFASPALSLRPRNRYFGLTGKWSRFSIQAMNDQLVTLSRVVIHPTYRGAGIASRFIRRSCELCPYPWIETLTEMGRFNPFFERAGFVRVGHGYSKKAKKKSSRSSHSAIYGGRKKHGNKTLLSQETYEKSRFAEPIYYVFDNRANCEKASGGRG